MLHTIERRIPHPQMGNARVEIRWVPYHDCYSIHADASGSLLDLWMGLQRIIANLEMMAAQVKGKMLDENSSV